MSDADLARLRWRCRRGLLELDLLLQKFLDTGYTELTPRQRDAFERLLVLADAELLTFMQGTARPTDPELAQLVATIRRHAHPRA